MEDKKISIVETVLAVLIVFPLDLLEVALGLVGLSFLTIFADFIVMSVIHFWLWIKGGRWEPALFGNAVEFLPVVDMLPIRTAFLIFSIYKTNYPSFSPLSKKGSGGDSKEEVESKPAVDSVGSAD